jgi:exodeoxyribonuclease VIII
LKAFAECPSRWKAGYQSPDSDAKDWGSLLDCVLLTPDQFKMRYAVKPATYNDAKTGEEKPWNGNSNVCKDWLADHQDMAIVSNGELSEAQKAAKRLLADETISSFHNASDKQVHVSGFWHDKATGLDIPVQCLIDYVPNKDSEFQKCLGDLKSTRNAGQKPFARWCYQASYHIQAAFDLALYCAATGEDRTDWVFVVQENYPPYETGRRLLSQEFIEIGRLTYEHALKQYAKCLKTGNWPGYDSDDEMTLIQAEPWMAFESMETAMENDVAAQLEAQEETEVFDVPTP